MTNLNVRSESFGGSDDRWLGSREGLATARTVTLSAAAFTEDVIESGYPVALVGGVAVPYAAGAADGSEVLAGFVATDQDVSGGDAVAPIIDRGRVIVANLPVAFTAPADSGRFVFVS